MSDQQHTIDWDNRIVGYDVKPADQFQANPHNWRTHPQMQRDAVRGSLNTVGWIDVAIENVTTGHLIDGHERVWQALDNDNANVPYIQVELTEEEERFALMVLDPLAELAEADRDILGELYQAVESDDEAVSQVLDDLAESAGVGAEPLLPEPDEQEEPELPGDVLIEIYCSYIDLEDFEATLDEWEQRGSVAINVS